MYDCFCFTSEYKILLLGLAFDESRVKASDIIGHALISISAHDFVESVHCCSVGRITIITKEIIIFEKRFIIKLDKLGVGNKNKRSTLIYFIS